MNRFPPLHGIQCDNLHNLVADALPSNGQWHTLVSRVRKTEDGVFQIDELVVREGFISDATFESGAKYKSSVVEPSAAFPSDESPKPA